jgi:hypothetical protein
MAKIPKILDQIAVTVASPAPVPASFPLLGPEPEPVLSPTRRTVSGKFTAVGAGHALGLVAVSLVQIEYVHRALSLACLEASGSILGSFQECFPNKKQSN